MLLVFVSLLSLQGNCLVVYAGMLPEKPVWSDGDCRQEEPRRARRSQEEPGGARRSKEEPGRARRSRLQDKVDGALRVWWSRRALKGPSILLMELQ